MYCQNCGKEIPDGAKFCPECGHSSTSGAAPGGMDANTAVMFNKKSEGLALILSLLITGLGQIYVGQTTRGIWMLVGAIILWVLTAALLFPGIILVVLWIYGMYDAYKLANDYNHYLLDHNGQPPW